MSNSLLTYAPDPVRPIRFLTLIEALAAAPPQREFVTIWKNEDDVQTLRFGEFLDQARAQASILWQEGLRDGDRMVLIMPQGIPLMTTFVGAMLLGAAPAILPYPNFKVEPAKYRSGLAGVSANLKARLVVVDEDFPEELLRYIDLGPTAGLVRSRENTPPAAKTALAALVSDPDSLAFIQHSAGTTGLQKGVALSNAAVLRQLSGLAAALRVTEQDRIYSWLPLYHDMGLIACFMLPLVCHLPVVMQSPVEWVMQPRTMLRLISQYQCTLAWAPNFTFQFLARRAPKDRTQYDLSSLRALINAAEPVGAQSMDEFLGAYSDCGLRSDVLQSAYGMAETVFTITQSGINGRPGPCRVWINQEVLRTEHRAVPIPEAADGAACFVSSGQCLPGCQVRIVSSAGDDLPESGVGEILIRSDSMFNGYYNRPDLTAKVLRDGWYWSGDVGFYLDRELYVIGRKNDMIIFAGHNIYPQDVEEIVCSHPAIHDGRAVALGLYNPDLGTEEVVVVAEVHKHEALNGAPTVERDIRSAVRAELGVAVRAIYIKPPRWIVKSTAGKPARFATRDKLFAEHPELSCHTASKASAL